MSNTLEGAVRLDEDAGKKENYLRAISAEPRIAARSGPKNKFIYHMNK
jgi:hypothetical protein